MTMNAKDMEGAAQVRARKIAAKKEAVAKAVRGDSEVTLAALAERFGVNRETIRVWLREMGLRACPDSEVMGTYGTGAKAARMRRASR